MENQQPTAVRPSGNKRVLIAFAIMGLVVVVAVVAVLVGGWAYRTFTGHNMAGLEGTWHDGNNPQSHYEFKSNGDVDTWNGPKAWWKKIGWSATWRRDGQEITIRTDRNWDFVGHLDGETIRGKMIIRDENGATATTTDSVWQKD